MKIGSVTVNYMSRHNQRLRLWLDIKAGRFWYVFIWPKGAWPYMYRSFDGTPISESRTNGFCRIFGQETWD